MSNVQGELGQMNKTLGLINEYLLNQGGKKMSYANLVQQDMRLSILLVLEQDPGYSQNEHLLRRILGQVGPRNWL